ncbi:two-component system chemotaxis sensor kinase CheA [Paenibacillus cellulosilyticus]|uniref:Chemotaxis protein CheA n=1 Tax=Paenibacillus cellulosilyticus TaxID=375489 RepID=A0A2V2Z6X4_9BACL|nr:chemotaxis protein CheW [Paenibacillus cellulosilyticus]PWW07116.1 two-component system chemotaxis sensor kinase CheA [Paenibacillus cellulosilyticus]QKS44670.1 chemotaxis protein CheW [Paenibacillus cellulosilyticus]
MLHNDQLLSTYLNVYLDELDEQVQIMDEQLLEMEQHGSQQVTLQTIFRAAHTLKGSSAVMGFNQIKNMTHKVETVFDGLRSNRLHTNTRLMNTLFRCVDYLKRQRERFLQGVHEEEPIGDLVVLLDAFVCGDVVDDDAPDSRPSSLEAEMPNSVNAVPALANEDSKTIAHTLLAGTTLQPTAFQDEQLEDVRSELASGAKVHLVEIKLKDDTELPFARALLTIGQLREAAKVLAVSPDEASLPSIEQGTLLIGCMVSECDSIDALAQFARQLADVEAVQASELTLNWLLDKSSLPVFEETSQQPAERPRGDNGKFQATQTVRVDVNRLEHLLNLVGELVIGQTRLIDVNSRFRALEQQDNGELALLEDVTGHISRVVAELQDGVMKTRMLPIEQLFNRFPRLVRDLAQQVGKEVDLVIEGKETELDRTLIEEISDPLIHILRNAVDHGLELPEDRIASGKPRKGRVVIRASHEENTITIRVSDNGRGIHANAIRSNAVQKRFVTEDEAERMTDKEAIGLIFHSGMSTAEQVTDVSGRGVGMDIVKTRIEKLNGIIDIDTTEGVGTTFTVKLPLTLAIIRSLLVGLGDFVFALPIVNVIEISHMSEHDIKTIHSREMCMVRGELLPFVRMDRLLGVSSTASGSGKRLFVVTVGIGEQRVCLLFDRSIANQEIVVKSLGSYIGQVPCLSGSTIMGDGSIALILDIAAIVRQAAQSHHASSHRSRSTEARVINEVKRITFLLSGIHYGIDIQSIHEIVRVPDIKRSAQSDRYMLGLIQLRDQLMPLYQLSAYLTGGGVSTAGAADEQARVLVVDLGDRLAGLLVDEVLEVVSVTEQRIEQAPEEIRRKQRAINGVYRMDEHLVYQLSMDVMKQMVNERQ